MCFVVLTTFITGSKSFSSKVTMMWVNLFLVTLDSPIVCCKAYRIDVC